MAEENDDDVAKEASRINNSDLSRICMTDQLVVENISKVSISTIFERDLKCSSNFKTCFSTKIFISLLFFHPRCELLTLDLKHFVLKLIKLIRTLEKITNSLIYDKKSRIQYYI